MSRLRSWLRPLARFSAHVVSKALPTLLRVPTTRRLLNATYERTGHVGAGLFAYLTATAEPRNDFVWRTRVGAGEFGIPVAAQHPRSWSDALLWRWPPVLPTRAFYEWYLTERRGTQNGARHSVLLDVGANDGMITYPFAASGWRCVSFEPQEDCLRQIRQTCRVNDFDNVLAIQSVVTSQPAAGVDFFVSDSSWYSSLSRDHVEQFENARMVRVPAITLDGFLAEHDMAPTCIKIDVEGAEADVLDGARHTLEEHCPELVVEVLTDRAVREQIWGLLEPLGYRFYVTTTSRSRPLQALPTFAEFAAAAAEYGHGDFVMIGDAQLNARIAPLLCG